MDGINLNEIVILFFKHQLKIKTFHFQTKSYGAHKAADEYLSKFGNKMDRFMEAAQGKTEFGRLNLKTIKFDTDTLTDDTIVSDLDCFIGKIIGFKLGTHSDLISIRDDILLDINQFKYLLTFK